MTPIKNWIDSIKSDSITAEKITDLGYKDSDDLIRSFEQRFAAISKKNKAFAPRFRDGCMKVWEWQMIEGDSNETWDYKGHVVYSVIEDYLVTYDWYSIFAAGRKQKQRTTDHNYYDHYDDDYDYDDDVSTGGNDTYSQAELDNHANQCNPNNDAYHSSRR